MFYPFRLGNNLSVLTSHYMTREIMSPERHRLLLSGQGKSDDFSDVETEDLDVSPANSKPRAQKWPANFVLIQVFLIAIYTVVGFAAASLYTRVALSPQSMQYNCFPRLSTSSLIALSSLHPWPLHQTWPRPLSQSH